MSCGPKDHDFWRDTDAVVVPEQPPVAVYTNTRDEVLIRQCDGDDDSVILIRPENVAAVARAMLTEVGLEHLMDGGSGSGTAPRETGAAARMRRYRERQRNERNGVTPDEQGHLLPFQQAAE